MGQSKGAKPGDAAGISLQAKVHEWISQQGYPLEWRVADELRTTGLLIQLGHHLKSAEGKCREIDVCINHRFDSGSRGHMGLIRIFFECKHLRNPWVLPYGNGESSTPLQLLTLPRSKSLTMMVDLLPSKMSEMWEHVPFWKVEMSHGAIEAFTKQPEQDRAWMALQKASSSLVDQVAEINTFNESQNIRVDLVALSCIVVEGDLFEARREPSSGEVKLKPIFFGRVDWMGGPQRSYIDIVHVSALPKYAVSLGKTVRYLEGLVREMWKNDAK